MTRTATMLRLEHVGIAVLDAEAVADVFRTLFDREPYAREAVAGERVRTTFIEAGPAKIELLESTDPDSVLGRYIARHGPGLHHLAFEVDDLDAVYERLTTAGFRLLGAPRPGADGKRIFFVHPRDTAGVLIECCAQSAVEPGVLRGAGPAGAADVVVRGGVEESAVARSLSRRLRVWFDPAADPIDDAPVGHHLVVFGDRLPAELPEPASAYRVVLVDPPVERVPLDRSDLLVIRRSLQPHPSGAGRVVHLPQDLLQRLPDPSTTLADVLTAHLTA